MKFRDYLELHIINHWRDQYLDYEYLKQLMKDNGVNNVPPPSLNHSTIDIHNKISRAQSILKFNKNLPIDSLIDDQKTPSLSENSDEIEMDTIEPLNIYLEVQNNNNNTKGLSPQQQHQQIFSFEILEKFLTEQHHNDDTFDKVYLEQIDKINGFFMDRFKKFKSKSIELCNMISFLNENNHLRNQRNISSLKQGFQENFKFLTMLKSYRLVNLNGFKKSLSKYDVLQYSTESQSAKKHLLNSNIYKYEEQMEHLIQQIKIIYSRYFTGNDLKLANTDLKGTFDSDVNKSDRYTGFVTGILIGISIVLGLVVIYTYIFDYPHDNPPIDAPLAWLLFRISLLPILLGTLFSLMTFIWSLSGINYVFIFEFKPDITRSTLRYFRVSMIFICFWLVNLFFYIDTVGKKNPPIPPISYPIIFISISILMTILPFPILQKSTRFWILKRIGRVVSAPFVPVKFADFFMSIQLLGLCEFLFNIQTMICVSNRSSLQDEIHFCSQNTFFTILILNALPFYWRVMQCFRRYYETRRFFPHMTSAIRSIFSIITLILSYLALRFSDTDWSSLKTIWFTTKIISTFYKWYADLAVDWGFFLNRKTNAAWPLREKLIYKKKFIYYLAIITDLLFRFLWLLIFIIRMGSKHRLDNPVFLFFFSIGGVLWASQFIFFRVECEHCQTADHYSTFHDFPMSFSEEYTNYLNYKSKSSTTSSTPSPTSTPSLTSTTLLKQSSNTMTNRNSNDSIPIAD